MFLVTVDKTRNLLHFTIAQTFDAADAAQCLATVKAVIGDLRPGFVILTDVRYLQSMDPSSVPYVKDIMKICNANRVSKIVRIVPKSTEDFGLKVMSVFHYDSKIPIVMCTTFEEALKRLPEPNV